MVGHVYQDLDTHGPSPQERQDLWLSKPRMIFGTRPHGHRPRLCSFLTSTPILLPSTTTRRSVHRLSHRSTQGLVIEIVPKMVLPGYPPLTPAQVTVSFSTALSRS